MSIYMYKHTYYIYMSMNRASSGASINETRRWCSVLSLAVFYQKYEGLA